MAVFRVEDGRPARPGSEFTKTIVFNPNGRRRPSSTWLLGQGQGKQEG